MRFQVIEEKFGNQLLIKLMDSESKEYVSILPETGGMLNSMELVYNNKLVPVLDDYKTEEELLETLESSFKGSNLFPFPNRIKDGKYDFNGKIYQLKMNFPQENNAIHGLVFTKKFKVTDKSESDTEATLSIAYSPKENAQGYPFSYTQEVKFSLSQEKGLIVTTSFKNTDSIKIPTGLGWHPYFMLTSKVDDIYIQFPSKNSYEVDSQMIPTGKSESYTKYNKLKQIEDDKFDTCFDVDQLNEIASIILKDPSIDGGLEIWQETGNKKFNFLQVYTPPHRNNIAIEPMTCMPDAFNNKQGLIILEPNEKLEVSWGVKKI
ncbi:MAG: aldose 1-epimerase [Bacteroidales bacterium]|nr:aldose 1-epimerase [Bacteroidales bacterium]MBN2819643.1 aldose 1-epimerase [Bacteroidales bacterium]